MQRWGISYAHSHLVDCLIYQTVSQRGYLQESYQKISRREEQEEEKVNVDVGAATTALTHA